MVSKRVAPFTATPKLFHLIFSSVLDLILPCPSHLDAIDLDAIALQDDQVGLTF
jgi:hypothetical protein